MDEGVPMDDVMDEAAISAAIADPRTYADPQAFQSLFAMLRREQPLRWTEPEGYDPFWFVSRHQDIMDIERNSKVFVNAPRTALRTIEQEKEIFQRTGSRQASHTLIQMDGAEHAAYRKLTQAWFMPPALRDLHESLRGLAASYVDRLESFGGTCDFASDIAIWYPLRAIMLILGVPEEDESLMLRLTQQHFGGDDPEVNKGQKVAGGSAAQQVFAYFTALTEQRRRDPKNDIVSLLANAEVDGQPISDLNRNSYYFVLALAGHDTTSSSISGLLQALMERPEMWDRIREDRSLLDAAIEEGLRWTSPVRHFFRTATQDIEVAGQQIKAGDTMMLSYLSANYDESVFDAPLEFRLDRKPNRHIAFGFGLHQCIGQHLARIEMRSIFTELLDRVERVEPAGPARLLEANFVGGIRSLPIQYRMRDRQLA